jgi:hypothetical protein
LGGGCWGFAGGAARALASGMGFGGADLAGAIVVGVVEMTGFRGAESDLVLVSVELEVFRPSDTKNFAMSGWEAGEGPDHEPDDFLWEMDNFAAAQGTRNFKGLNFVSMKTNMNGNECLMRNTGSNRGHLQDVDFFDDITRRLER